MTDCKLCGVSFERGGTAFGSAASGWAHPFYGCPTGVSAPVVYWPKLCSLVGDPDEMFETLMDELPWERRDGVPRDEVYYNDTDAPYTYGSGSGQRTYSPLTDWHPVVTAIREELQDHTGGALGVCFLNRYMGARDALGWHADDSPEMDPTRPVVTVSLGAERDILFQSKESMRDAMMRIGSPEMAKLRLEHGSAAVMLPGMQNGWLHRIPKSSESHIGPRISLTYRGFIEPKEGA